MLERRTYTSMAETYHLDPRRIGEVFADMVVYMRAALQQEAQDNPKHPRASTGFSGLGQTLTLFSGAIDKDGQYRNFDLAELVLADDSNSLTLNVNPHPKVDIPSGELHAVAQKYILT